MTILKQKREGETEQLINLLGNLIVVIVVVDMSPPSIEELVSFISNRLCVER